MKIARHKYVGLQKRKARAGYMFILPFIIGFLVFMVKPLCQSLYMSFCTVDLGAGTFSTIWTGLENYRNAFLVDPEYNRLLVEEMTRMMVYSAAIIVFSSLLS